MGGHPKISGDIAGKGGDGGDIWIECFSGYITFIATDLYTGAGVESVCSGIYIQEDYVTYRAPIGCLGGKAPAGTIGSFAGGDGGTGGNAGNIYVIGDISPDPVKDKISSLYGFNRENPNLHYSSSPIGTVYSVYDSSSNLLYRINTIGGSGGIPGGAPGSFPGRFGAKGEDGTITGSCKIW